MAHAHRHTQKINIFVWVGSDDLSQIGVAKTILVSQGSAVFVKMRAVSYFY